MDEYVGIIRTESGLLFAKKVIENMKNNLLNDPNNSKYYYEALNMAQTSLIIINSALNRKENIGCHYRIN